MGARDPDAERPPASTPGAIQIVARQSIDRNRDDTPGRRQERLKVLENVMALIALDVAHGLDRRPEGWPEDDFVEGEAMFWRAIVDEAVRAGVERYRQAHR